MFKRDYTNPQSKRRYTNLTPHTIVVRTNDGDRKFEPSGQVARVQMVEIPETECWHDGIPSVMYQYGAVEGMLPPDDGCTYIVSSMVAQALKDRFDVVAPDTGPTAIRENGQVVAVVRFQRFH